MEILVMELEKNQLAKMEKNTKSTPSCTKMSFFQLTKNMKNYIFNHLLQSRSSEQFKRKEPVKRIDSIIKANNLNRSNDSNKKIPSKLLSLGLPVASSSVIHSAADDEPYSPGDSDDDDVIPIIPTKVTTTTTTTPSKVPDGEELLKEIERKIAASQIEIARMVGDNKTEELVSISFPFP